MANIGSLMGKYDKCVIFDTETPGLSFPRDEIIEFSAVVLEKQGEEVIVAREYDNLVTLTPGNTVPANIEKLTGISTLDILQRGIPKAQVCADIAEMFAGNTLLLAYNAHFDLSFLFYLLLRNGDPTILKGKDKLDLLTVYKDRRPFPHKLCNAIDAYGLSGKVVNSHRAIDDVLATVAVMEAMANERDDLEKYINLFGYNPKYGIDGKPIGSVTYKPQRMHSAGMQFIQPLYTQNL
jgi:DNA polymerase III epsilon subunit-like protein